MWGRLKAGFAGWVRVAPACVASVKREAKLMSRARFPKTETYSCRRIDRTRLLLTGDHKLARPDHIPVLLHAYELMWVPRVTGAIVLISVPPNIYSVES